MNTSHRTRTTALVLTAFALVIQVGCETAGDKSNMRPATTNGPSFSAAPEQSPRFGTNDSLLVVAPASTGEVVYVPTYSHIFTHTGTRELDLAITLSIRNTDPEHPITVARVRYFNSDGELVRTYVEEPRVLDPLSSMVVVIEQRDRTGGAGANFLVRWQAERVVSEPVIEAVMISTTTGQGVSFVSRGVVVRPLPPSRTD